VEHAPPRVAVSGIDHRTLALTAETVEPLLESCGPLDAIVHLAGNSSVGESWSALMETFDATARTTAALAFQASARGIAFVNPSSAEIFGASTAAQQTETTPIAPISPYGVAKAAGHLAVRLTRDAMGARATNLIFFPGESTRRKPQFVCRKITRGLAAVKLGRKDHIVLGDTSVVRDFCYADDFARAAEMFALGGPPGDYVCASGEAHQVSEIATECCELFGLDPAKVLRSDRSLFRAADSPLLVGDASKLRALGWAPSMTFRQLVRMIAEEDLSLVRQEEN
jgi:GDPmannose 4,6-dehydratase